MQLNKNADLKIFEIWVSRSEKESIEKSGKLNNLFALCNEYGYKPVVFVSGDNDFVANTTEIVRQKNKDTPAA